MRAQRIAASITLVSILSLPAFAAQAEEPAMSSEAFAGLKLRNIGPALMAGRISDIAIDPADRSTWYVAVGSGGVWKTIDAGTTWTPIFDKESSYSIGCVSIDPINSAVIWVGTGENVSGRHVGFGDGVYKSLDGGANWKRMGLEKSEHIARILIDPRNSDVVYVAAEGPLWSAGGERGVYKTTDGGNSWEPALEISENTGVTSLEFDPINPDVLYAAAYQRRRTVWSFLAGGPESGIYKSTDGGESWRKLERGLPKGDMGKIGLAVSPVEPDYVYATVEATEKEKGFYRSTDAGESWEKRSSYISGGTGPHYYQEIYASPHDRDLIYQADVWLHVTEDGGKTFHRLGEEFKHSDNHALVFDPEDPQYLLVGCDGGLYETFDQGKDWRFFSNMPITQFYKLALDNDTPFFNIAGGTQDNNSQLGPSRTLDASGIRNQDWIITMGGDGYSCQIDPEEPNLVYAELQVGTLVRFDKATGQRVDIQPQPGPEDAPERWNWDAPILISPHSHTRLYYGSQRLWRSDDRGDSWTPVSGDLTRNQNRLELEVMGRVWSVDSIFDHYAMSYYDSTTSISESPLIEGLIYVGTDDGLVQVTEDGGRNWRRIDSLPGVPDHFFVNEVKASPVDPNTVFVAVDNHKSGDFKPYLLKSTDRGRSWTAIAGDLPDRHLVWSVEQDQVKPNLLFAGTEFGIFFTLDGGTQWMKLSGEVPTIAFRDIEIQRRETDLVGASFGRGFFVFDDYSPLRTATDALLAEPAHLFPIKKTLLYVPREQLGDPGKAFQGAAYFTAPNPPFGAVVTYHLSESLETAKAQRRKKEQEIRKEGGNVPFPGWDALEKEAREEEPQIVLTVQDASGKVIQRVMGPASKGFHRVAWDLRYPSPNPIRLEAEGFTPPWARDRGGPLIRPGRYTVTLSKLVNGQETEMARAQSFDVVALGGSTLPEQDPAEVLAFQQQAANLVRLASGAQRRLGELATQLKAMHEAAIKTPAETASMVARVRNLELRLADLRETLTGNAVREERAEPISPAILDRARHVYRSNLDSTYGPTETQRRSYQTAESDFTKFQSNLEQFASDVAALSQDLQQAGAPYVPQ